MATEDGGAKLAYTHPKSKFLKAITDRQQEITDWAKEGRKNIEHARHVGQLTENVTLDLMLQEHLLELSRARYKYKINTKFEKKMFLQRQMMKSSVLREKLKNVHIEDKRPKWAQGGARPRRTPVAQKSAPHPPRASQTPLRMAKKSPALPPAVRKPGSAPLRRNPVLVTETPRAQTRTTFYDPAAAVAAAKRQSPAVESKFFQTELDNAPASKNRQTPTIMEHAHYSSQGMLITPATPRNAQASPHSRTLRRNGILRHSSELLPPPKTAPDRLETKLNLTAPPTRETKQTKESLATAKKAKLESWAETNRAVNDKRYISDARYLKLERSLTEQYLGRRKEVPNVNEIVQRIDTLHIQPKRRAENRPRVSKQMKAMFAQKEASLLPLRAY